MARKILILRWAGSAYDSLGGLLELVAQEYAAHGVNVVMFAADGEDWPKRLVSLLRQEEIAFALTMSGIGADTTMDGKLFWEAMQVPLFNWSCDHPCYYPQRHTTRSRYLMHGYVFPDHARYNRHYLNSNGTAFAVHLGIPPRSLFGDVPLPAAARNGRILFSKSGADFRVLEARWRNYSPELSALLFETAETLMHGHTADVMPTLERLAEPHGLFLHGHSALALKLVQELDGYIRIRRADLVMRSVRKYPVDVFGAGWDHLDWTGGSATYHGPLTWRATIERLPAYSACLSINPLIDESAHDRVFFALAAGVPPVSDSNAFSRAQMPELEPYAYAFEPERIEQAVEAVLADPVSAAARTEATWHALSGRYGLRHSALQIARFAGLQSLNRLAGS